MSQKISVLIIEDEKSICDFVAKTLQSMITEPRWYIQEKMGWHS